MQYQDPCSTTAQSFLPSVLGGRIAGGQVSSNEVTEAQALQAKALETQQATAKQQRTSSPQKRSDQGGMKASSPSLGGAPVDDGI